MNSADDDSGKALAKAHELAIQFLNSLSTRPPATRPDPFTPGVFPVDGSGAEAALARVWDEYGDGFSGNAGPRYWAFITGGVTPAALAGDWLTSALDQNVQ